MTKAAVKETYEAYFDSLGDEVHAAVEDEFGGGLLGKVAGRGAKPVLKRVEAEMDRQGEVLIEFAAADDEAVRERYRREFLETNPVYQRYGGDREPELRRELTDHFEEAASDLAPLIDAETDDFWAAMRETYSEAEARDIFDRHFSQAATFKKYREGVFSSRTIGSKVINIVDRAERRLRERIESDLSRAYEA